MSEQDHVDPTSAAVAEELRATVGRMVRRFRLGYTIPSHQFSALATIENGGPQTTSQLAHVENVRPQSMAHTVQQLLDAGFITRRSDPSDGRQTLIELTQSGQAAIFEQRHTATGWLTSAIDDALTPPERATLIDAVNILDRLTSTAVDPRR